MIIRAVTFDLDDTLWPIEPVIVAAERALWTWLEEHCPRVATDVGRDGLMDLREQVLAERPEVAHDFSAQRLESLKRALTAARYEDRLADKAFDVFFQARNRVTLFDDVVPALDALHGRYALGAISNGNADLELTGLDRWLTVGVSARSTGTPKPDPGIFAAAADALGYAAHEIVHVGDHPQLDAAAARAAGYHALWLNRDDERWEEDADPPPQIASLAELPVWLAASGGE